MKIHILHKIGNVTSPGVANHRSAPGNFTAASEAAVHYAKKNGTRMVIVPGNSYGNKVYHIARETDSLSKYQPGGQGETVCGVVTPEGEVFQAVATAKSLPESI